MTDAQVHQLATYALAGADGLFITREIGGDAINLIEMFELHARAVYATAVAMIEDNAR